jgi:two-component system, NarL family, response regulator NreC
MNPKIKVLIFEKSYLIRQGLISILESLNQCELAEDFSNVAQFQSSIKMLQPRIIIINTELLSEIPAKTIKTLKKEYEFILIGLNLNTPNFKIDILDEIIDYDHDKQRIIKTLTYFVDIIVKEKGIKKPDNQLSEREKDIVVFAAKGLTNKEIASKLFLSVHTVITHRKNISRKLGIKSVAGLTVYAILNKLIDMKDLY